MAQLGLMLSRYEARRRMKSADGPSTLSDDSVPSEAVWTLRPLLLHTPERRLSSLEARCRGLRTRARLGPPQG